MLLIHQRAAEEEDEEEVLKRAHVRAHTHALTDRRNLKSYFSKTRVK